MLKAGEIYEEDEQVEHEEESDFEIEPFIIPQKN